MEPLLLTIIFAASLLAAPQIILGLLLINSPLSQDLIDKVYSTIRLHRRLKFSQILGIINNSKEELLINNVQAANALALLIEDGVIRAVLDNEDEALVSKVINGQDLFWYELNTGEGMRDYPFVYAT